MRKICNDMEKVLVKRIFLVLIVGFMFLSFFGGVLGAENPLKEGPEPGEWYTDILINLFGETWEMIISALLVLLMITAGVYDILIGFSLFSNKYVQLILALGLGVIAAMSGTIMWISKGLFKLGSALGAGAVLVGVGVPLLVFIVLNVIAFKLVWKLKSARNSAEIEIGAEDTAAAIEGLGNVAHGFKKSREEAE